MITSLLLAVAMQVGAAPSWQSIDQEGIVATVLQYDIGIAVNLICRGHDLTLAITGLPPAPADAKARRLELNVPGNDLRSSTWTVRAGAAIAPAPAIYARRLRVLDNVTVRTPGSDSEPARRYELPLPADHSPLDRVLAACGVSLVSETDANFDPAMSSVTWTTPPRIIPPSRLRTGNHAEVTVECLVGTEGQPENCQIVNEQPENSGFARAALASIRTGRLGVLDGAPPPVGGKFRTRLTIDID